MTRYTVAYTETALGELAEIWLNSPVRGAVTEASDTIDRVLGLDAGAKGEEVDRDLRKLVVIPLVAYYVVSVDDRLATVWSVRIVR